MNDPRRPGRFSPPLSGPTGPQGFGYPPPADPAYADQAGPYAPTYGGVVPQWAPSPNDTSELPPYWQQEAPHSGELSPDGVPAPPTEPKSPRWLWVAAGAAVLLVLALVIALVLANDAIKTQTAVPPLPAMPTTETPTPTPSTRTSPPSRTFRPVPPPTALPPETTGPAVMQDVVYSVTGEGRAISIVYIGTGDVVQTEFNVELPWTKEVSLSKSAVHPANVTVVNFGHNVTCSLTIAGVQVSQRVGAGITICDARG
jgi:Mycobacterium membrane protein